MRTYDMKQTALRIRNLRNIHRYTQERAAELLGIDRRSLSNIENAAKGCSLDLLIRVSDVYSVSLDYLLFGEKAQNDRLKVDLDSIIRRLAMLRDQL